MTIVTFIPVIFAIVGLLLYLMAARADVKEIGRITFFCGLFFTVSLFATDKVVL